MEAVIRSALVVGAGQAGTFAARALVKAGLEVVAADLEPSFGYFARYGDPDVELLRVDVRDARAIRQLAHARAADLIVLTAGIVGEACDQQPNLAREVNVGGAETVAAVALAEDLQRVVAISTLSVYGRSNLSLVGEDTELRPFSLYGQTKARAEDVLLRAGDEGLDVRILRPCGIYGPLRLESGSHSARFIESALVSALQNRPVRIVADPETSEQYLYAKDLGRAIALACLADAPADGRVFNVAPERPTGLDELRLAIRAIAPGASIEVVGSSEEGLPMPRLDTTRFRRLTGFSPRYTFEEGLRDYAHEAGFLA